MAVVTKGNMMRPEDWPNLLIQTDNYFRAPDGRLYQFVYGPVDVAATETLLGFEAKGDANYVFCVGKPGSQMIIAGCRVHYMRMCPHRPENMADVLDLS